MLELAALAVNQERSPAGDLWSNARGALWDPEHDDGDSRRLQVVLLIDLDFYDDRANAWNQLWCVEASEPPLGTDPAAAARMAVLRVAAQMGAALKEQV